MLALVREGYGREIAALFILTVLAGALIVGGVGALVDRWLSQSVESLAGVPGEYDIIVQLQAEARQGLAALRDRLAEIAPGYRLKVGPTLLGRANIFVGFPAAHRNPATFETIDEKLRDVPGYEGFSVVVEPAVTVKGVHPGAKDRFLAEALRVPGALFAFESHGNLWIVADRPAAAEDVRRSLEEVAERLGILSLSVSGSLDESGLSEVQARLDEALAGGGARVRALPLAAEEAQVARDLAEVKRLLTEMGGTERERLQEALERAREAISQAVAEGSVREDIAATLDAFEQAVLQLETLERRALELSAQLKEAAGSGPTEVLIALLLQRLLGGAFGSGGAGDGAGEVDAARGGAPGIDVERLKSGIASLADRLVAIESIDFDAVLEGLRRLEQSLSSFDRETEQRIFALIDRAIEAQGGEGLRLDFLVEGEWAQLDPGVVAARLGGEAVKAYVRPAGVVEPDPRTVLSQTLSKAADAVALLAAVLVVSGFFVFDMATVVSFVRSSGTSAVPRELSGSLPRRRGAGPGARGCRGAAAGAALWGGVWTAATLSAVVWLAGHWEGIGLSAAAAGFAIGALLSLCSHRLAPVDPGEVEAGLSLGLGSAQILREIVVPDGRPGMLAWLNNFGRRLSGAVGR